MAHYSSLKFCDFEEEQKTILLEFFRDKNGVLLTGDLKEKYCKELKEKGLCDKQYRKDYSFDFIIRRCKEYQICDFKRKSKCYCELNPEIQYRKKYTRILLTA